MIFAHKKLPESITKIQEKGVKKKKQVVNCEGQTEIAAIK